MGLMEIVEGIHFSCVSYKQFLLKWNDSLEYFEHYLVLFRMENINFIIVTIHIHIKNQLFALSGIFWVHSFELAN